MNIFVGLLFIIAGGLLIYFYKKLGDLFGKWKFAEEYLGGTDQGYILIGFFLIVLGILSMFGVINLSK